MLALGVSLWEPIRPGAFALTLACALLAIVGVVVIMAGAGNLVGVVLLAGAGVAGLVFLIACAVGLTAPLIRGLTLRPSIAASIAGFGFAALLSADLSHLKTRSDQSLSILDRVAEIRKAELSFADSSATHGFTCNGPDLPGIEGISWSSDALGGQELNRARIDGHWLYLRCPPSWSPQSLGIQVLSPGGQSVQYPVTRQASLQR